VEHFILNKQQKKVMREIASIVDTGLRSTLPDVLAKAQASDTAIVNA